jgi:hypothetical protein
MFDEIKKALEGRTCSTTSRSEGRPVMTDAHRRPTAARIQSAKPVETLAPRVPPEWMAEDDRRRAATMAAGRERRTAARQRSRR